MYGDLSVNICLSVCLSVSVGLCLSVCSSIRETVFTYLSVPLFASFSFGTLSADLAFAAEADCVST